MEDLPTTAAAPAGAAAVRPKSFTEKITDVFASPGELFDNVRDTPATASNWVVPALLFVVIAFAMSQVIMHTPSLADQLKVEMTQKLDKQFEESIKNGKMTPEQAEQAREQAQAFTNPASPIFMVTQGLSLLILTPIALFALALVYWLLGKSVMKAQAPYIKVVEVLGLALFIFMLESIVTTILAVGLDNLHANASLALAVLGNFSTENKLHLVLSKINLFTIWILAVVSIGLARLFRRDTPKVAVLVFALWALWVVFTVFSGLPFA